MNHDEFVNICNWKTERPKKHYEHKDNKDILKEVNKKIFPENVKPKLKLKELLRLEGVGVPVASALLTVIFPEEYCVIDFRVRQSLLWIDNKPLSFKDYKSFSEFIDNLRKTDTVNSYMRYLGKIKELAQKHKMTPREIEMALWQYDKDKGIKKQMG